MCELSCCCHCQWGEPDTSASLFQSPCQAVKLTLEVHISLPGWKSTLQFWIWTSVLSDTHGRRWAGLSKLCLGSSIVTLLPACHMNPSKTLSPEGLGSHSRPLPDNSGTVSCRRTECTTQFAIAHENVPRFRHIQIRERWLSFCLFFCPSPVNMPTYNY